MLVSVAPGRLFAERDFFSMQALNARSLAVRLRENAQLLEATLLELHAEKLEHEARRIDRRNA
jgi:hypothetical protein